MEKISIKAKRTFWQAFFAYIVTSFGASLSGVSAFDCDAIVHALVGVIVGAVASGLSATYNGVVAPMVDKAITKANGGDSSNDEG